MNPLGIHNNSFMEIETYSTLTTHDMFQLNLSSHFNFDNLISIYIEINC
jgi:hypothetical protein